MAACKSNNDLLSMSWMSEKGQGCERPSETDTEMACSKFGNGMFQIETSDYA